MHKGNEMSGRGMKELRRRDQFVDRRSGEDRREVYSLEYFKNGGVDRRSSPERRDNRERRIDCVRVSEWSSACPNYEDKEYLDRRIEL